VANLPPVSLIPVVHLDLQISPQIFEKIRNSHNGILWGWGKLKKPEAKNRDPVPLMFIFIKKIKLLHTYRQRTGEHHIS
jgi:hypothetical protein